MTDNTSHRDSLAARAWRESVDILTYEVGAPDPNPCFLEKRVYQGSSGAVYPFPVVESVANEKTPRTYQAIYLENEYLKIMILPELGGRVQMALDKTNDYHFVYYNRVIKPALVGLAGPWISGGIEFNWPQHHRPSTFHPVDSEITQNDDGSVTVWCHEVDRMVGTRGAHGLTLHPGRAYLEVRVRLSNRTALPETFLWWANPAVHVDENHQSIFPPDVCAVMDHGKRDVSSFPIATGKYYKVDYSPGTDISRYRNIPVPTSYMAYRSDYDFVGSYDHGRQAGLLHVASHHVSPGKKQWTWGCGDFGKAWDRHLTDEDGPYIELMCGVYTDNQPDFSWLNPGEEKAFTQYFMPYKGVGVIKNATIDAVLGIEPTAQAGVVRVYATAPQPEARLVVKCDDVVLLEQIFDASPTAHQTFTIAHNDEPHAIERWRVHVYDRLGRELVAHVPRHANHGIPAPALPIAPPRELDSTESLYLAGLHLEQYRHATRSAEEYFREALRRDPGDLRCNLGLGRTYYRRGCYGEAESCFRKSVERATRHNPNPIDGEAHYQLGLALAAQRRLVQAEAAFHKAAWDGRFASAAMFEVARIGLARSDFKSAETSLRRGLEMNARHHQARHLLVVALALQGKREDARRVAEAEIADDPFNAGVLFELSFTLGEEWGAFEQRLQASIQSGLDLACDYAAAGQFDRATKVLERLRNRFPEYAASPLVLYHLASLHETQGDADLALSLSYEAAAMERRGFFPSRLSDLRVLEEAVERFPGDYRGYCDLGNLLYSKRRYEEAIRCWEASCNLAKEFAQPRRNLGLAYFNKRRDPASAWQRLAEAHSIAGDDPRILFELDQLAKRLNHMPLERLSRLDAHLVCLDQRDDLTIERITILNQLGRYEEALECILGRRFHPWEGGEGKVSSQYVFTLVQLARRSLERGAPQAAIELLQRALQWPESLGEGKLAGAYENDVHYWMGVAQRELGQLQDSVDSFRLATRGSAEPTSAQFYNDQPPEMVYYQAAALHALGDVDEAALRFQTLVDYGRDHRNDVPEIDFFAVSLPDFLVFDADLALRNELHCRYMEALGRLGLGDLNGADQQFTAILELDVNHQGAIIHRSRNPHPQKARCAIPSSVVR
ncbi:MAG: DUF5107 domain-containing protein [Pirellulales bacterium]|nr:DUF5107 domain-containing protein [Pirellulales bacterium]